MKRQREKGLGENIERREWYINIRERKKTFKRILNKVKKRRKEDNLENEKTESKRVGWKYREKKMLKWV